MTEPISDEDLERVRRLLTREQVVPRCTVARLLARLDAAEAIAEKFSYTADDVKLLIAEAEAERDAALARAVPDGWKVEWDVDGRGDPYEPFLVPFIPADTEPGEPT